MTKRQIIAALQHCNSVERDARVWGRSVDVAQNALQKKEAAKQALIWCRQNDVNWWDFLKEVGI